MAKVTVKELEALTAADVGKRIADADGVFGVVRSRVDGMSVAFKWRYRIEGSVREIVLGTWPKNSLQEIRTKRKALAGEAGTDHAAERIARRESKRTATLEAIKSLQARQAELEREQAELAARQTVQDLYTRWSVAVLSKHRDEGMEPMRVMQRDVMPHLGAIALEDVKRSHIVALVDRLTESKRKRIHIVAFALTRQMFRWAVGRGYLEHDPTAAIKRSALGKNTERDRVLAPNEIAALDKQMLQARLTEPTRLAVWLALATGCRIGELLKARWDDVMLEGDAPSWTIPATNTKNGKQHQVYLSAFAVERFKELIAFQAQAAEKRQKRRKLGADAAKKSPWCFPGRTGAHMHENAVSAQIWARQLVDTEKAARAQRGQRSAQPTALVMPGGHWVIHDLRRTAATMMGDLGVRADVIEKVLNHMPENSLQRVYQRQELRAEQRDAWRILGERLAVLRATAAGGNVVIGQFGGEVAA